jgi:hypothetical protein
MVSGQENLDGRFAIVEDILAAQQPSMWMISSSADSLEAAQAITHVNGPVTSVPMDAYEGECVAKTLVFRTVEGSEEARQASIVLLKALHGSDSERSNSAARPSGTPNGVGTRAPGSPDNLYERVSLARAGVAESDRDHYAAVHGLAAMAELAAASGDFETAERKFGDLIDIARRIDDPASLVKGLGSRGSIRVKQGRIQDGIKDLTEALAFAKRNNIPEVEGPTLSQLAEAHMAAGNPQQAIEMYKERCALASRTGDTIQQALSTANLGMTLYDLKRYEEASTCLQSAIDMLLKLRFLDELRTAFAYQASAFHALGDERCIQTYEMHLMLCRSSGDFSNAGGSFLNLSQILHSKGRVAEARSLAEEGARQMLAINSQIAQLLSRNAATWRT